MTRARLLLRSTKVRVVLAVAACWLAFQLWLAFAAPGKVSPELAGSAGRVNVQVDLPFSPERFHVLAVQRYGRIAGADEHSINLRGVRVSDLTALARPYWIKKIEPLREED
jgi:hypothetical protein